MRRFAVTALAALTMILVAVPVRAAGPRLHFEQGYGSSSFWVQTVSETERVLTSVSFLATERGSTPGASSFTFLGFAIEPQTWDGASWQVVSGTYGQAFGADVVYSIGPGGRTITVTATVQLRQCSPFPNCVPLGSTTAQLSLIATDHPLGHSGHHLTDWSGNGCEVDFIAGSTITLPTSATASMGGIAPAGDLIYSSIQRFQDIEVNLCLPQS